jgi:hypothetical protein
MISEKGELMENLIKRLNSPDEGERVYAVQDIAETNDSGLAILLLNRLPTENSPMVRDAILFALKQMPCREIYGLLFELLRSSDAWIRNAVVAIFGTQGDTAAEFLANHRENADRELKKLISDALFLIGTPNVLPLIRMYLDDSAMNVKITAVEYLGRLEDKESLNPMIRMLEKETEPMLRIALLETMSAIGTEADILQILSVLGMEKGFAGLDPLYIPEIIRLSAKSGNEKCIIQTIGNITDTKIYADDIIRAIGTARRRFDNILKHEILAQTVFEIAKDKEADENVRDAAAALLLGEINGISDNDRLCDLGAELAEHKSLMYSGIRLMAFSGKERGRQKIKEILTKTGDGEIRSLCEELLDEETTSAHGG